ncbi:hypothetical protein NL676_004487 [Syzygium grande]|nr:hypothetical protein NL676_004487 [Syzygium grande]
MEQPTMLTMLTTLTTLYYIFGRACILWRLLLRLDLVPAGRAVHPDSDTVQVSPDRATGRSIGSKTASRVRGLKRKGRAAEVLKLSRATRDTQLHRATAPRPIWGAKSPGARRPTQIGDPLRRGSSLRASESGNAARGVHGGEVRVVDDVAPFSADGSQLE